MYTVLELTGEELSMAKKLNDYFRCSEMGFREKVFHALLIAQHDLEAHHYCSESERLKILAFTQILDALLNKLCLD